MGHLLLHWWYTISGANNEAGPVYGSWSGILGATAVLSWPFTALVFYYHNTCHFSPWCVRWAHHPLVGGKYKVCSRHEPSHENGKRPRGTQLWDLHRAWEAAAR